MSLLFRDRISIALAPDKVVGVRFRRGFTSRLIDKRRTLCQPTVSESAWTPSIAALVELLDGMDPAPANVTLILSNRFGPYALVPWTDKLSGSEEELRFARHIFAGIYGDDVHQWDLRLSPTARREPRVASAVDRALLESIKAIFEARRLQLYSIQPYLMAAHNLCRRVQNGNDYLFLLTESCSYTCAAFRGGTWQSVHSGVIAASLTDELPFILDRECLWSGMNERPAVFLYAPEQPDFSPSLDTSWVVHALQLQPRHGFSPSSDSQYAMAMSAK